MSSTTLAEIAEYQYQLEQISGALEADQDNEELLTLKHELQDLIELTRAKLPSEGSTDAANLGTNHEKKRKHDAVEVRKVGDQVLAKWVTGDHQFYSARITSITGNQADPIYTVKFAEYNEVQTLHGHQIRTFVEHKKRVSDKKHRANDLTPPPPASITNPPDGSVHPPPPPPPPLDGPQPTVVSKKKSNTKEDLSRSANTWASFAKSGPKTKNKVGKKKAIGEGSMFRTEENGRVGVIGSGRSMTSDPGRRERHVFHPED